MGYSSNCLCDKSCLDVMVILLFSLSCLLVYAIHHLQHSRDSPHQCIHPTTLYCPDLLSNRFIPRNTTESQEQFNKRVVFHSSVHPWNPLSNVPAASTPRAL